MNVSHLESATTGSDSVQWLNTHKFITAHSIYLMEMINLNRYMGNNLILCNLLLKDPWCETKCKLIIL